MICRKCNKEIEDNVNTCPFCGEQYRGSDYIQQMLEHAMGDNTQSSDEIEKLKETMDKKKRRGVKKLVIWGLIVLLALSAIGAGIWYLVTYVFVDRGNAVYTASFDGDVFTVIDEEGNEIRSIASGTYSEASYDVDGNLTLSSSYFGPVSFEKTEYDKDGKISVSYTFDGASSYGYSDWEYEYDEYGNLVRLFRNGTDNEMDLEQYFYEDGVKTRAEYYVLLGSRKHEFVYDSVGRITGEKDYDDRGNLVYDKEYSYLPDGTLYLSSENKIEKKDGTGAPASYRLTKYNEDGSLMEAAINDAKGQLVNKIQYSYEEGRLTGEKIYNPEGVEIGAKVFLYTEDGTLEREVRGGSAGSGDIWYTYKKHENGENAVVATAAEKDSDKYITYSEFDEAGRETKKITAASRVEYEYDENGNCISETLYDSTGAVTDEKHSEYDAAGNVIKTTSLLNGVSIYMNEYDDAGGLSGVDSYSMFGADEYEYEGENVIKETHFGALGKVERASGYEWRKDGLEHASFGYAEDGNTAGRIEYRYNGEGVQTGLEIFDSEGRKTGTAAIEYDDKLKIITVTCTDSDGNVYYSLKYNYSKNEPGIKIEGTTKLKDSQYKYSYTYAFNDEGRLALVEYSNEKGDTRSYSYQYDELGNPTSGSEKRSADGNDVEVKYSYTYENGCLHTIKILQNGEETTAVYELDENKRPRLKGSVK